MNRILVALVLVIVATTAFAQQASDARVYNERGLQLLGLSPDEIRQVLRIQNEAAEEIRRHRADQEIKKAELARLLLDENPNMRLIERNLRDSADIEVDIRMVEIRREIEIRGVIGTERWARLVQALRERSRETAETVTAEAAQQLRQLQRAITEKQRELQELVQGGGGGVVDDEVREQFRELQLQYQELQQMIRDRL